MVDKEKTSPRLFFNRRGLSVYQIIDAFPDEARELAPKAINRLNRRVSKYKKWIEGVNQSRYDDFTKWFIVEASLCLGAPIEDLAYLKKLKKIRQLINKPKDRQRAINETDILHAKSIPIESFIEAKRRCGRYWARCPIHGEKTPSFVINKDNTYHCYGCGAHGDSIDLVQKLYNKTFVEAVKWLISI